MRTLLIVCALFGVALAQDAANREHKTKKKTEEQRLYDAASTAFRNEKFGQARDLYLELLTKYPRTTMGRGGAVRELGQAYLKNAPQAQDRVIACLRKLIDKRPWSNAASRARSLIFVGQVTPWKFGQPPNNLAVRKQAEIKIPIKKRSFGKKYLPKYKLYQIPPKEIRKVIEELQAEDGEHYPMDSAVPREMWRTIASRVTLAKWPRFWLGTQVNLLDKVHADLSTPGYYVLEQKIDGFHRTDLIQVQSFGIVCRSQGGRALVYAVDPYSGMPVAGVDVRLRMKKKTLSGQTNKQGLVFFDHWDVGLVIATRGNEVYACGLESLREAEDESRVYITTDRPIYRPGQTVHFKAILRNRQQGVLSRPPRGENVQVEIRDEEGRILKQRGYAINEFGSLSGEFQLGDEPRLGKYYVVVHKERREDEAEALFLDEAWEKYWRGSFVVREYRKPEFEVTVSSADKLPTLGAKLRAKVHAEYYFGGPVADAEVEWKVVSQPSWDSEKSLWQAEPFEDPRGWFYRAQAELLVYEHELDFDPFRFYGDDKEIASGKGRTDKDGSLAIAFDAQQNAWPLTYRVEATVRDLSRLTAEGSTQIEAHPSAFQVKVGTTRLFYEPGELMAARVRVTTVDGQPVRNREVQLNGFLLTELVKNGSAYEKEFETFYSGKVRTDAEGLAKIDLKVPGDGMVRLRARLRDNEGRRAQARCDLWVAGKAAIEADETFAFHQGESDPFADADPFTDSDPFGESDPFGGARIYEPNPSRLQLDRLAYQPGETVRLMIRTHTAPATGLLTISGLGLLEVRLVQLDRRCQVVELPVGNNYPPNVNIEFMTWKDGKPSRVSADFFVYPHDKLLDVQVETDRDHYSPRQKARITINTRSAGGGPIAAEIELGIIDRSLFALEKDRSKDPRAFFFPARIEEYHTGSTLPGLAWYNFYFSEDSAASQYLGGVQTPFVISVIPMTHARVGLGGGGGGFFGGGKAAPTETRTNFADTFYWAGHVRTNSAGKAVVTIDVPDNLTSWRIVARAVAGDDQFGVGVSETVTRKDVILRLAAPRFYTQRDEGVVSTIIRNNLDKEIEFTVRLHSGEAEGGGQQKIRIGPNAQRRIDWPIKVTRAGTLRLRAEALSTSASDAMEIKLPVRPYGMEAHLARAGKVDPKWTAVLALPKDADLSTATLHVTVGSASVSAIRDALPYLAEYPYGCVEQTMSRFLPAVVASRAMKRAGIENKQLQAELPRMVDMGLQRLYGFQHDDGGWGWWKHDKTDEFMTAYVVQGLVAAKTAGYWVDPKTLENGIAALSGMKETAYNLYVLKLAGEDVGDLSEKEHKGAEDLAYLVLAGRKDLAIDLPAKPPKIANSDSICQAALVLRALVSVNRNDKRIAPLIDWLMSRRRGGQWISTYDTACVVFAFTELAQPEKESRIDLVVNGKQIALKSGVATLSGRGLKPGENRIELRQTGGATVYASAMLKYFSTNLEKIDDNPNAAITIQRRFERAVVAEGKKTWKRLASGETVTPADELRVVVLVRSNAGAERVMIESPLPAGAEARTKQLEDHEWFDLWYSRCELRDDRVSIATEWIGKKAKEFHFRLRPTLPGKYQILPAVAFPMYDPDKRGVSKPFVLQVADKKDIDK